MKKKYLYITCCLLLHVAMACKEGDKNKVAIKLGDTSLIVTETDSNYLQNFTEDISPAKKKSAEAQISTMMVQVDSLKTSQKMEAEDENEQPAQLNGFTINFNECNVVYEGISAHALNATQNERASESVSYLMDAGTLLETKLEISSLSDVKVEERLFVKLALEKDGETIILNDLSKFLTQWFPLAGKNNRFVSVGANSLQFDKTDGAKIKNALEKELKKKRRNKDEVKVWMDAISKTKTQSDAPCKLVPVSAQWRINGKSNGKVVRKLIQFDIAH